MSAEEERRVVAAYREVFATESGRVVLDDMITRWSVLGSSMNGRPDRDGQAMALHMAHVEGAREVVRTILLFLLEKTWEDIIQMVQAEARQRERNFPESDQSPFSFPQ